MQSRIRIHDRENINIARTIFILARRPLRLSLSNFIVFCIRGFRLEQRPAICAQWT